VLPAVGHLNMVNNSVDVASLIDGNRSFAAILSYCHAEILEGVRHRDLASGLELIVQSRCNGSNKY